ncbi:MAG: hypothetical protein CSA58_06830 [Micrococcales bacterium]|nr:MAG: hypothetical protein CSA58_06830 [Micrococcales bacterium]
MAAACAFVGITTLDVIQRVSERPRWGKKSVADSVELAAGGPATNAAVTCAWLRGSAWLIGAVGSHAAAGPVVADLSEHGVLVHDCAQEGWVLPVASAIVEPDGERTVVSTGALGTDGPRLTDAARAALHASTVVLLDGHHPGLGDAVMDLTRDRQLVVLDAGSAKPHAEQWLSRIDVLAASAGYATGLGDELTAEDAIRHGLDRGCRAVVVTDGPGEIRWGSADGARGIVAPPSVVAVDTLGAGDAFHGALVAALAERPSLSSHDLPGCVRLAAEVAAVRVGSVGARAWMRRLPRWAPHDS